MPVAEPVKEASLHAVVHGRVQGVGFRYFAIDRAQKHGLVGWVRNLESGGVEVWAEGSTKHLESFLEDLQAGPPMARVQDVTVGWGATTGRYQRFSAISTSW